MKILSDIELKEDKYLKMVLEQYEKFNPSASGEIIGVERGGLDYILTFRDYVANQ